MQSCQTHYQELYEMIYLSLISWLLSSCLLTVYLTYLVFIEP